MDSSKLYYGDIYRTLYFHKTDKLGKSIKVIMTHDLVRHHALLLKVKNECYIPLDDVENIIELLKIKRKKHFMKTYPSRVNELYVLPTSLESADLFNMDGYVTLRMVKENIKRNS